MQGLLPNLRFAFYGSLTYYIHRLLKHLVWDERWYVECKFGKYRNHDIMSVMINIGFMPWE